MLLFAHFILLLGNYVKIYESLACMPKRDKINNDGCDYNQ